MENIRIYFNAERAESLVFIAIGIIAFVAGIYFLLVIKKQFYTGMAWSLIIIAVIQLFVGGAVFIRSPKDIARVEIMYSNNQKALATEEIPRMETVMKNFAVYRWVEIALAAVGVILILTQILGSMGKRIGAGLFIQALLLLMADYFAMERGQLYLDWLRELVKNIR